MIRVRYTRFLENEPDVWLDGSVRAVRAETYADLDDGQGGVTRADLKTDDILTLDQFALRDDVFVESDDPTDVLDDTDIATEVETRIWWRAVIVGPEA